MFYIKENISLMMIGMIILMYIMNFLKVIDMLILMIKVLLVLIISFHLLHFSLSYRVYYQIEYINSDKEVIKIKMIKHSFDSEIMFEKKQKNNNIIVFDKILGEFYKK